MMVADVAIATSNAIPTTAFHAIFIFFILLLAMVFFHFLLRLSMNALRNRKCLSRNLDDRRQGFIYQQTTDAYQVQSAPLTTGRDEDWVLAIDDSSDIEKNVPAPPPPAYGRWRGSVVCT